MFGKIFYQINEAVDSVGLEGSGNKDPTNALVNAHTQGQSNIHADETLVIISNDETSQNFDLERLKHSHEQCIAKANETLLILLVGYHTTLGRFLFEVRFYIFGGFNSQSLRLKFIFRCDSGYCEQA